MQYVPAQSWRAASRHSDRASVRRVMHFAACSFLVLFTLGARTSWAQHRLQAVVVDAETWAPLPGAHVMLVGTTSGGVTNAEGRFTLIVQRLPAELRVRHIGYESQVLHVEDPASLNVIELQPAVVELDELLVTGETFAEGLMRKVLNQKRASTTALKTYEAQGFSRVLLERNGTIVYVGEATFDQFWQRERGSRAVVTNFSETAAWYDEIPLPHAAHVPNLYGDNVSIQGLDFIGPTHPDALDRYTFRLAGRRMLDEHVIYDLYVSPRDERLATFVGTVSVLDSAFALVRAELRPARHVAFPVPLDAWRVAYIQQFAPVDQGPWLPIDLQIDGSVAIAVDARRRRTFDINQRSQISHYSLNSTIPESVFAFSGPVVHDNTAVLNDPHFMYGRVLMPLTARETEAIERLRKEPLTLRAAFPPVDRGGRLSAFLTGSAESPRLSWPTVLGYEFQFGYNRVDGLVSSLGNALPLTPRLQVDWRLAQATHLRRVRSHIRARRLLGGWGFAEVEYRRTTRPVQQPSRYSPSGSSLQPLLGGDDYFDYFWLDGGAVRAGVVTGGLTVAARLSRETHRSVERSIEHSWPFREPFRLNPPIPEGILGAAALSVGWAAAEPSKVLQRIEAEVEHAPGELRGFDFDFTRFRADADMRIATFFRSRPAQASLEIRMTVGTSAGRLPIQRYSGLDGSLTLLDAVHVSRFGAFRSLHGRPIEGEHHLGFFWKHDFTTWPFERSLFWPLAQRGMGITVFGGHGRTWISDASLNALASSPSYENGFVHEIGVSISNVAGTLLRLDLATRLDRPGVTVGVGASLGKYRR